MSSATLATSAVLVPVMPSPVRSYVEAANRFDLDGLVATFADEALVNDQQREYGGRTAIRGWAAREIIADRVTMAVTGNSVRDGNVVVTANVDGDYDKTGLPDPLVLTSYFTVRGDRIGQLLILHNKAARISSALALPPPLAAYFAAKAGQETGAMLACFTPDAIVVDEAQERRGHAAIRGWIEASARRHHVTVDVIGVEGRDGKVIVAGLVSGDFPGSPVKLRYAFFLADGRIARLEIVA